MYLNFFYVLENSKKNLSFTAILLKQIELRILALKYYHLFQAFTIF